MAEDNLINQKIANYILAKQGADVTTVGTGLDVLESMKTADFDIILMDLQMPGMDGFEAARTIRKSLNTDIPIIALTADLYANEYDECTKVGINACISKPFDPQALCDLIVNLIHQDVKTNA